MYHRQLLVQKGLTKFAEDCALAARDERDTLLKHALKKIQDSAADANAKQGQIEDLRRDLACATDDVARLREQALSRRRQNAQRENEAGLLEELATLRQKATEEESARKTLEDELACCKEQLEQLKQSFAEKAADAVAAATRDASHELASDMRTSLRKQMEVQVRQEVMNQAK